MILALLFAFTPTMVVILAILRSARNYTPEARFSTLRITSLLSWLGPYTAILAGWLAAATYGSLNWQAVSIAIASLLTFIAAQTGVEYIDELLTTRKAPDFRRSIRQFVSNCGVVAGTGFFLMIWKDIDGSVLELSVRNYVYLTVCVVLAQGAFDHIAPKTTDSWQLLAHCSLRHRIYELAHQAGLEVTSVFVCRQTERPRTGAFASEGGQLGIYDHLVTNLSTDEMDWVLAHELGHVGDRNIWGFTCTKFFIFFMTVITAGILAEKAINFRGAGYSLLNIVKWLLLPLIFPLLKNWFCRLHERHANLYASQASTPETIIRGIVKLAHLNQIPLYEPAWAHLLSTHPDLGKEIDYLIRQHNLSREEIALLTNEALRDLECPSSPRYETAIYEDDPIGSFDSTDLNQTPEPKTDDRPNRVHVWLTCILAMIVIGPLVFHSVTFVLKLLWPDLDGMTADSVAIVTGLVSSIIGSWLLADRVDRRTHFVWEKEIEERLNERYPGEILPEDVLVMADFAEANDKTAQMAFFGIREDRMEMVLLGERNSRCIQFKDVERIESDPDNGNSVGLVYFEQNARIWLRFKPLLTASPKNRWKPGKTKKRLRMLVERSRGASSENHRWTIKSTFALLFRAVVSIILLVMLMFWVAWCLSIFEIDNGILGLILFVSIYVMGTEFLGWTAMAVRPPKSAGPFTKRRFGR